MTTEIQTDMQTAEFLIPEENLPKMLGRVETINKKAVKNGLVPMNLTVGEVQLVEKKNKKGKVICIEHWVPIILTGEYPAINGWKCIARIDHRDGINLINIYDENNFTTGEKKVVEPWVIEKAKEGMRLVVLNGGTAYREFQDMQIQSAGKTGTAEYCDDVAQSKNRCQPGNWPTHSWYAGYAPFDDPEIAVVAFVYNGGEGASVAGPIVRRVLDAYFELKAIDSTVGTQ